MEPGDNVGWAAAAENFTLDSDRNLERLTLAEGSQNKKRGRGRPRKRPTHQAEDRPEQQTALVSVSQAPPEASNLALAKVQTVLQPSLHHVVAIDRLPLLQQELIASAGSLSRRLHSGNHDEGKTFINAFMLEVLQPTRATGSKRAEEKIVGGRIDGYHEAVASGLLEFGTAHWSMLLQQCLDKIRAKEMKGLLFVKQRLYDETPLKLRHKAEQGQSGISKVLQTQFRVGLLVQETGETSQGSEGEGKLHYIFGYVPTVLQALQEKKAEDILTAELRVEESISLMEACSKEFSVAVQLITTDRDGTNMKAERGIQYLHDHFSTLHLPCDVHKLSTSLGSMLNLVPQAVTGIVNFGLLLRPAGAVQRFRDCLMESIRDKLRVIIGPPPDGQPRKHRESVYRTFLGSSFSNADVEQRHHLIRISQIKILSFFLNGDLEDEEEICFHCPCQISREVALELFNLYVPYALLPKSIAIFPRHRWHGVEIPVDQLALISAHHGLLRAATLRFLKATGEKNPKAETAAATAGQQTG